MIDLFTPTEAVTMENFNKRLTAIREALPELDLKIATGSYVGTGTGGSANTACTLSFDFAPLILLVQTDDSSDVGEIVIIKGCTYANSRIATISPSQIKCTRNTVSFSNNDTCISWYCDSFSSAGTSGEGSSSNIWGQLNESKVIYRYLAIGT